ncbi:MAG: aminotransferase class III-fold pyridoxal phosphate-dependent enzyme, partial [Gammaproteobacteria bacterium]|nr:aminotransferase class III-fold pyridoxal phosphate-dependent enzyme [Gammaproteobacteria bacterium]
PLVVRLEGTNVDLGKKIIRESGLNVIPADDLDDAAQKIVAAVKEALDNGIVLGGHNETEAKLAQAIVDRWPSVERVRFTNSGTEANLLALSTARAITGRDKVMGFAGSYHGSVISFGAYGRGLNVPFDWTLGTYNDVQGTRETIRAMARDLAAVVVEPMTGSGGCIPATPAFIAMLREETERAGSLLLFDEVMTSRLSPGGLHGLWNVQPDLVSFGKYLGGGLTFGAFGGARRVMERFDPRRPDALAHAGTFNNNVLSLSAAIVGLEQVYTPEAALRLNASGDALRERLNQALERQGIAGRVTGIGSMMMVHLTDGPLNGPTDSDQVSKALRGLMHLALIERGIYIARRNMIVLSLPMGEAELDTLTAAFEDVLHSFRDVLPARRG